MTELDLFFELAPDPLCLLTAKGLFTNINKSFRDIFGYTDDDVIENHYLQYIHPEDKDYTLKQLESLQFSKNTYSFENRFLCGDNCYKYFSWTAIKLPDNTVYISARNITNQEIPDTRRHLLLDSEENYSLLFYSNPVPILIYDINTTQIINANQMALELYGYTLQEFLNLSIKDIRPPNEIPKILEAIKNRKLDKEINNLGTWNHLRKNGDQIKVEVIGHSIQYLGKHCMIVVCNNVTEQLKTLQSLESSIERFEYVTEATSDIIWDWDLESNEVYYSGNLEKSFGHNAIINIGNLRFFERYVHPDDKERVVLYAESVKHSTMINWTEEYRFQKANGEYALVLDKGIVIRDEKGIGTRMIGAMQDITEVQNKDLHILKQKDQLMEIAQINAHEIRRPVATILGLSSLFNKATIEKDNLEVLTHLETTTMELDLVIRRIIDKTIN